MSRAETCCVAQTKFLLNETDILNNATKSTLCNGDIAGDRIPNTGYGISTSLSADGNILAVGAPEYKNGAVFVYKKQAASGTKCGEKENPFVLHQLIETGEPEFGLPKIEFGLKVALSSNGRRLVVAGRSDNFSSEVERSGAVFVYDLKKCNQCYSLTQKLIAQKIDEKGAIVNDAQTAEEFGASIALSADGSVIAVASGFPSSAGMGAVYIYAGKPNQNFVFKEKLQPTDNEVSEISGKSIVLVDFGYSLSLSGDGSRLVVGAPNTQVSIPPFTLLTTGAALVFENYCKEKWALVDVLIDQPKDITSTLIGLDVSITADGKNLLVYSQSAISVFSSSFVNAYTVRSGTKYFSLTETLPVSGNAALFDNSVRQEYLTFAKNACSFTVSLSLRQTSSKDNKVVVYRRRSVRELFSEFEVIETMETDLKGDFGFATAMSADGSRLVISARGEESKFDSVFSYKSGKLFQ